MEQANNGHILLPKEAYQ